MFKIRLFCGEFERCQFLLKSSFTFSSTDAVLLDTHNVFILLLMLYLARIKNQNIHNVKDNLGNIGVCLSTMIDKKKSGENLNLNGNSLLGWSEGRYVLCMSMTFTLSINCHLNFNCFQFFLTVYLCT